MEIFVMTRSLREGEFSFCYDNVGGMPSVNLPQANYSPFLVKHLGKGVDEEEPTRVTFPATIKGPFQFQLKIHCNTGSWSSESFLVAAKVRHVVTH